MRVPECQVCFQDPAEGEPYKLPARDPRPMCRYCKRLHRILHRAHQFKWILDGQVPIEAFVMSSAVAEFMESTDEVR